MANVSAESVSVLFDVPYDKHLAKVLVVCPYVKWVLWVSSFKLYVFAG